MGVLSSIWRGLTGSASLGSGDAGSLVRNGPDPGYASASRTSQELSTYFPPLHSADSAILPSRPLTTARTHDLVRNDPTAVAAVNRLLDLLVGAGVRLSARPNARALGLDPTNEADRKLVRKLGQQLETEWELWMKDPGRRCDSRRKLTGNGLFRLSARTYATLNETTHAMRWRNGGRYSTCVAPMDPERLSNPNGAPDFGLLRGGIEFSDEGEPLWYNVRQAHPGDWYQAQKTVTWDRFPRVTSWGRPVFIHGFEEEREGASRAMSPFAALVSSLKMISTFAQMELNSATVNAMFAAFVESNLPPSEATSAFTPAQALTLNDSRMNYWEKNPPKLMGVRIPVLPLGDKITINSSPRQTAAFESFMRAFLQRVAAARGISYEQLAMDWTKTNYSSARAALNEVWRTITRMFAVLTEQVFDPIRYCVVEEGVDRGYIEIPDSLPDFWDVPAAYLNCRWIGPGRGYVDPTKEAEAASMRMDSLTSSLQDECAEQGKDWEDVLDQLEIEQEELTRRNLARASVKASAGAVPGLSDKQEEQVAA